MDLKLVLFDFDGTLLDSCGENAIQRFRAVARQRNLSFGEREENIARSMWGAAADEVFFACWPEGDYETFYRLWVAHDRVCTPPLVVGVESALAFLRDRGISMGIVTNRPKMSFEIVARRHRIRHFFTIIFGREDFPTQAKKNPESAALVLRGLARKQFSPRETVFVGDSEIDIDWARRARIFFVGVTTGNLTYDDMRAKGLPEQQILNSVADLPALLLSCPGVRLSGVRR